MRNSVDNSIVEYEDGLEMSSCNVMDNEDELDSVSFVDSVFADEAISSDEDVECDSIIGNDSIVANDDVELVGNAVDDLIVTDMEEELKEHSDCVDADALIVVGHNDKDVRNEPKWKGFKICGDNIDKTVKPRNMTINNQSLSFNYFNSYAVLDRIDMSSLSGKIIISNFKF